MATPIKELAQCRSKAEPSAAPLAVGNDWAEVFAGRNSLALANLVKQWLPSRRWFRSKARTIESVVIHEQVTVPMGRQKASLLLFKVKYNEGEPEFYVLPLAVAFGLKAQGIAREWPHMVLSPIAFEQPRRAGILFDAIVSREFCSALLALTAEHRHVPGQLGDLETEPTVVLSRVRKEKGLGIAPSISKAEQSNSSVIFDSSLILKFFRRLDAGINPELEIERFLSEHHFPHSPALAGALEYHDNVGQSSTMAVITSFVPGCHDAWQDTLVSLGRFYKRVKSPSVKPGQAVPAADGPRSIWRDAIFPRKPGVLIGSYLKDARTLGRRTASLHLTLASEPENPAFRPESWTFEAQQALFDSVDEMARRNFELLRQKARILEADSQDRAEKVVKSEPLIMERLRRITQKPLDSMRIRTHGDYHLGQVLHHGADFLIIDFEGEPAISLADRREKQSAFRDVAGMIYSFFYASNAALRNLPVNQIPKRGARGAWARYWSVWVSTTFLRSYLETTGKAAFIPPDEMSLKTILDFELLRKAIYELGYELNNRPDWASIAFQVLLDLLNPDNPL
jgi:maltose alpha-D-glucosyltransferase/alpha-amylase